MWPVSNCIQFLRKKFCPCECESFTQKAPALLADRNGLIFSQIKSGTTYLCHILAFYNALRSGENCDFDEIARHGVLRTPILDGKKLCDIVAFKSSNPGYMHFVQTHYMLDTAPGLQVLLTRNVLDYCVSALHWKYWSRPTRKTVNVEVALDTIVNRYIQTNRWQGACLRRSDNNIVVDYDDLVQAPYEQSSKIIQSAFGLVDTDLLRQAIKCSQPDRLVAFEKNKGRPVVAPMHNFDKSHFVRSGAIGEGHTYFTDEQKRLIRRKTNNAGVALDGRIIPSEIE